MKLIFLRTSLILILSAICFHSPGIVLGSSAIYTYTYQTPSDTFTWDMSSTPIPDSFCLGPGCSFNVFPIYVSDPLLNNGNPFPSDITFYNGFGPNGVPIGGFVLVGDAIGLDYTLANPYGPQLYSGPESSPTMLLGTFTLTQGVFTNAAVFSAQTQDA